jgi:hypothetical protein
MAVTSFFLIGNLCSQPFASFTLNLLIHGRVREDLTRIMAVSSMRVLPRRLYWALTRSRCITTTLIVSVDVVLLMRERMTVKMSTTAPSLPTFKVSTHSSTANGAADHSNPVHSIDLPFVPNNSFVDSESELKGYHGKAEDW